MSVIKIIPVSVLSIISVIGSASALRYDTDDFSFRLTGYGTAGVIEPDFEKPDFLGDWRARAQINYNINNSYTIGTVYSLDAAALDMDDYKHDLFAFLESRSLGRIEVGFTDSVARKLSVGIPDVGGMRVNDRPMFYKKIHPRYAVISDSAITTGYNALRMNIVSAPINGNQYGLSVSGLTDDYDYSVDIGIKLRRPSGKLKTAYSFGASLTSGLDEWVADAYTPPVTADWRAQGFMGMNLQYNSWIWGLNARAIYDKNPVGVVSDGVSFGTGVSYDLLSYTVSLSYILSDTGIWDSDVHNRATHTGIASFRYKYTKNVDLWMSLGITSDTPFLSVALRTEF